MKLVTLYPYDPNGISPRNRVVNEAFTVSPPGSISDYSYTCLRAAPFFADTVVIKDGTGVGARTLIEGVDYWLAGEFVSASITLKRRICTMVAMLDESYSGTLYATYQTLGGNFTLADFSFMEELIRRRYTAIHISYEQIINLPAGFAPEFHLHELGDMVGMSSVVDKLDGIKQAISSKAGSYDQVQAELSSHVNKNMAHTPTQVGLGNVANYGVANASDVASRATNKYITANLLFDYVKQVTSGYSVDLSGYLTTASASQLYQPKGSYQPAGNYQPAGSYQPAGNYQIAGDYVTQNQMTQALTNYQPAGSYVTPTQLSQAIASAGTIDLTSYAKIADVKSMLAYRVIAVNSGAYTVTSADFSGNTLIRQTYTDTTVSQITLPAAPDNFTVGQVINFVSLNGKLSIVCSGCTVSGFENKTNAKVNFLSAGGAISMVWLGGSNKVWQPIGAFTVVTV